MNEQISQDKLRSDESPSSSTAPPVAARIRQKRRVPGWLINFIVLVIGISIGFLGRPLLIPYPADPQTVALQTVMATTRHFKGNDNAPVTIVEFGDFQ